MNKNVFFQHEKENIKNKIYPFLLEIEKKSYETINKKDQVFFEEIKDFIKTKKKLPFELNSQELLFLNKNPKKIWLEYFLFRYKFRNFTKNKIVADFPIYFLIEPVSACNLRCPMCFQVDKTFTRKPYMGVMKLDFYKKIIDECAANGTKAITLASRGEPTLHPEFDQMLRYASGKFFEIKINTNATRLSDKLCRTIIESGVNEMTYSVDESEEKKFEAIRVNAKFKEVLANIKKFNKIREEYPKNKTTTRISGVLYKKSQDMKRITNFWEKYVDHVVFVGCQARWDTYNNKADGILSPCDYLWERMYVWYDGTTNPCDADYKSYLSTGKLDYKLNTIKEIWNSKKYSQLREKHLTKKRQSLNPCDRCGLDF